jgi:hypothetical protein
VEVKHAGFLEVKHAGFVEVKHLGQRMLGIGEYHSLIFVIIID